MSVIIDTIRNIRKSLILDFVLLIQFASCFFTSTYLISYYFAIGETEEQYEKQIGKNLYWISLEKWWLEGSMEEVYEAKDCIEELRTSKDFRYMVLDQTEGVRADDNVYRKHVKDKEMGKFQNEDDASQSFYDGENNIKWTPILSAARMDWKGYQYLHKSLKEGREFEEDDFIRKEPEEIVPIMMGSDYADYFEVRDRIKIIWSDEVTECEVIGFLDKGSNANLAFQTYLDSFILYPSQDREYDLMKKKTISNEVWYYTKCLYAWIITEPDFPSNILMQELSDIMNKYPSLGNLHETARTFGMRAFRGEMKETVDLIAELAGIWLVFLIFTLFMILFHKIDEREREYAILLMNGIPFSDIIKSYLLELGIFLLGRLR